MPRSPQYQDSPTLKKYRELLGVTETATAEDLKKAYHQRAFLYHPDRNSDPRAPAQFQEIREAFRILSDPTIVRDLKQNHLKEKLFDFCIEGLEISFGAFFGHRAYVAGDSRIPREKRIGADPGPDPQMLVEKVYVEEDRSILDHSAFDSIEVVYAGRFSSEDEERLLADQKTVPHGQLPWVLLNNQGIIDFLNADYERSLKCYQELNQRMANNIIFMYREALCRIILAFKNHERSFFGAKNPNRAELKKGVHLLKRCILVGETRPVGKQKCLVIRKILADVLEQNGQRRAARALWKKIVQMQPNSVEAHLKSGYKSDAASLLKSRGKARTPKKSVHRALLAKVAR